MMDCKAYALIISFHEMRILDIHGDTSVLEGFTVNAGKDGATFYTMDCEKKGRAWREIENAFASYEIWLEEEET